MVILGRCCARPDELDRPGTLRTRQHTELLIQYWDAVTLWDVFGVVGDVKVGFVDVFVDGIVPITDQCSQPFTSFFPRADIHELLTPDLLHQVIKGTFKDHLVTWIEKYIEMRYGANAERIMDDIDRRYFYLLSGTKCID
jgi:hypothetical protein